jgi:hypothetical protein
MLSGYRSASSSYTLSLITVSTFHSIGEGASEEVAAFVSVPSPPIPEDSRAGIQIANFVLRQQRLRHA